MTHTTDRHSSRQLQIHNTIGPGAHRPSRLRERWQRVRRCARRQVRIDNNRQVQRAAHRGASIVWFTPSMGHAKRATPAVHCLRFVGSGPCLRLMHASSSAHAVPHVRAVHLRVPLPTRLGCMHACPRSAGAFSHAHSLTGSRSHSGRRSNTCAPSQRSCSPFPCSSSAGLPLRSSPCLLPTPFASASASACMHQPPPCWPSEDCHKLIVSV